MKINKIDLNKSWDFFNQSQNRNNLILKWGGVFVIYFGIALLGYFAIMSILFGSLASLESNPDVLPKLFVLIAIFYCFIYVFIITFSLVVGFYIQGSGINNFRYLKENYTDEIRIHDIPSIPIGKRLFDGFKYMLVTFVYMLPLLVLYFVWALGFVLLFVTSFSGDINDEMPVGFLIYYFSMFLVFGIQMVYVLLVQFGLRPVIYNKIIDEGYMAAANPLVVIKIFNKQPKAYFTIGAYLLLPMLLWMALYFANYLLVYLCIGIFILPFTLGLVAIIQMYIEPHILAQAFHRKK